MAETDEKPVENDQKTIPKPPAGVKARGKHLWTQIHTTYDFEDAPRSPTTKRLTTLTSDDRTAIFG